MLFIHPHSHPTQQPSEKGFGFEQASAVSNVTDRVVGRKEHGEVSVGGRETDFLFLNHTEVASHSSTSTTAAQAGVNRRREVSVLLPLVVVLGRGGLWW